MYVLNRFRYRIGVYIRIQWIFRFELLSYMHFYIFSKYLGFLDSIFDASNILRIKGINFQLVVNKNADI